MEKKTLAMLMAALSIGFSPVRLMSATAQDAPIIQAKGAAQTDQSVGSAQQQPHASGNQGAQPEAGVVTGGEQTQQPPTGSDRSMGKPTGGAAGKTQTQPSASTGSRPAPAQSGDETKPEYSGDGAAQGSHITPGGTSGTDGARPKIQKFGSQDRGMSSETQKAGDGSNPLGGLAGNERTNVNISAEQRAEIRHVVQDVHVEPVRDRNFTVSVGTAIPMKLRLEPLPARIVKIVPQYETYRFFILADGRIVIVDPAAYRIVQIITA